jgi:tetratricopeptide (TPR) repeat protein
MESKPSSVSYFFVDESGDPNFYDAKGHLIVEMADLKENAVKNKDVAQMLLDLANVMHLIAQQGKDYGETGRALHQALKIFRDLGEDEDVIIVLDDLGKLASEHKEYDAAHQHYREALELSWHIEDQEKQSFYSGKIGKLMMERKRSAEARQWFIQERDLAEGIGQVDLIAQAKYGIALTWEAEGFPKQALPLAQEALAIYERLQHRDLAQTRELVARLTAAVQKGAK